MAEENVAGGESVGVSRGLVAEPFLDRLWERGGSRTLTLGVVALASVGIVGVGLTAGLAEALLLLVGGGLVGTIALFWTSMRTLTGETALAVEWIEVPAANTGHFASKRRMLLVALRDLESERQLGKLGAADYQALASRYREELKTLLRKEDQLSAPHAEKAERAVREFLARKGVRGSPSPRAKADRQPDGRRDRHECPACSTSNEGDATFCKKCGKSLTAGAAPGLGG